MSEGHDKSVFLEISTRSGSVKVNLLGLYTR